MNIPTHVMQAFLQPLIAVFGEPSSPDPDRFLVEYGRHLKAYTATELAAAADAVARSHIGPARWPKLAQCIEACNDVRERNNINKPDKKEPSWRKRAQNAENLMMTTELGQQAARDGWANGCRETIMAKGRLPLEYELHRLIDNAEFINRCAAGVTDMGFLHKDLLRLAERLIERRHAIADRVLNGIVLEAGE